jgi:hypothetical protein
MTTAARAVETYCKSHNVPKQHRPWWKRLAIEIAQLNLQGDANEMQSVRREEQGLRAGSHAFLHAPSVQCCNIR